VRRQLQSTDPTLDLTLELEYERNEFTFTNVSAPSQVSWKVTNPLKFLP